MLLEVCREIKRFYEEESEYGKFTIENGIITGFKNSYPIGSHILIERFKKGVGGSILNSGVYLVNDTLITLTGAKNEVWTGRLYLCVFPQDFLELVKDIADFQASKEGSNTSIVSESFGIHSYSRAVDFDGVVAGWQTVFAKRLVRYKSSMFHSINI